MGMGKPAVFPCPEGGMRMEFLETPVFLLCFTLPIHWLAYYPFWDRLRFPKPVAIGLVAVTITVKLALNCLFLSYTANPYLVEYLFAPIHLAVYLVNIQAPPFQLLFTYILLADYLMVVKGISAFMVVGLLAAAPGSWQESAVCVALFAVSFPAMLRFFQDASRRIYLINAPIWNTIWTVPAFTTVTVLYFTRDFNAYKLQNWPFLAIRLGMLACLFAVCHILLQSLENFQNQAVLESQKSQMERVLSLQKEQYALLKAQNEETRRFRHDLRQRLVVANCYLKEGQAEKVSDYLNTLLGELPAGAERVCPNDAVNAVALYHQAAAQRAGISSVSLHLEQVPQACTPELEGDLCVLVGNLLENAVAACKEAEQPFLTMHSRYSNGILTLTMDNRFSTVIQTPDGDFLSTKQSGGIGLLSIRSIARKYGGGYRFETKGSIFYSSVYLQLSS